MKNKDEIQEATHAEFLNRLLKTNYKQYMKCTYNLHNGYEIWMIRFNNKQSKTGWTNEIEKCGEIITEKYTGNPSDRLLSHKQFPTEKRLVFGIYENVYSQRKYVFHGVYSLDLKSNNNCRIWNKISDSYNF